jgi:hypothetical protein
MSAADAMSAFTGLAERLEAETKALEQRKRAGEQNLKALEATQKELTDRVAVLMAQMKMEEGKVAEAQERARQITANAERQAFGIVKAAQMDAEALRERMRASIAKAQAAFQEMS